jgi:hypothetical protein
VKTSFGAKEDRMKKFILALSAASLLGGSVPAFAATQCRDSKGKFTKCSQAKEKPKPKQCRDKSGKFIKCK